MKFDRTALQAYGLVGQIGCSIGGSLVLAILGGLFLDNVLDTSPWFLLLGIVVGLALASYFLYRLTLIRSPRDRGEPGRDRQDNI